MILYLDDKEWVNQAGSEVNLLTGQVKIGWGPKEDFLEARKVQGSGTVMLFKRSVLDKIGGFEDWFLCYFDPEYCVRAQKAGFENWYEPKAICYHDQPKDDKLWRPRVLSRAYLLGKNRTLFMRKHGNVFVYTLFLPILLGYYLIEGIRFGIFSKWVEIVIGSIAGYFSPISKGNFIPLPSSHGLKNKMSGKTLSFIHTPSIDAFLSKFTLHIPFSYLWLYKHSLGDSNTILDVGCGDGLLMKRLSEGESWEITGIDIYQKGLSKAKKKKVYKELIKGDVVKVCSDLVRKKKKYESVFCSQVIEHINRKEGFELLAVMDKLASKRVVVATPRGFMNQPEVFIGGNPYQYHKSGWTIEDFKSRGFRVYGLGLKLSWSEKGLSRSNNNLVVILSVITSFILSPLVYYFPNLSAGVLCIRDK